MPSFTTRSAFLLTSFILYLNPIFQKTAVISNRNLSFFCLHLTLPEMHVLVLLMSPYFECPLEKGERVISIHSYHIYYYMSQQVDGNLMI